MGRKKSLSEVQRGQIVALHKEGLSERKTAARLKHRLCINQSINSSSMDPTRTCIGAEDQEKPRLEMTTS